MHVFPLQGKPSLLELSVTRQPFGTRLGTMSNSRIANRRHKNMEVWHYTVTDRTLVHLVQELKLESNVSPHLTSAGDVHRV